MDDDQIRRLAEGIKPGEIRTFTLEGKPSITHSLCCGCYQLQEFQRTPTRIVEEHREWEQCCICGTRSFCGIYYSREAPSEYPNCPHE